MPADYDPPSQGPGRAPTAYIEYAPTGPEGGLHIPTGRTDPALPDEPGRHPRLLRPAVPVQARRRAGQGQHLRIQRHRRAGRRDVPRAMRRAVRHGPHADALRCARDDRRRFRCVAGRQGRAGERRRRRRPLRGRLGRRRPERRAPGSGHRRSRSTAKNIAFDADGARAPRRTARSPSSSTTRTPGRRTTSRSSRARSAATSSSTGRSSRASPPRPTRSGHWPKGTYPFECFVHPNMTGTLTVQ